MSLFRTNAAFGASDFSRGRGDRSPAFQQMSTGFVGLAKAARLISKREQKFTYELIGESLMRVACVSEVAASEVA